MELNNLIAQLTGVIAFILLLISYYKKTTNKILIIQIISTILYCIHYLLLEAYSGLFICIYEVILDYGYYKTDLDKKIFLISLPLYTLVGILSYHTFFDLFSIFASLSDRYFLTKERHLVVIGGIITYILWLIYDIHVNSIAGIITDSILVISNTKILLTEYRHNICK